MRFNKKAELEEVVITMGVVIGTLIISIWFVNFLSNQTVKTQDLAFSSLNKFIANYELVLNSDEARLSGIEIKGIEGSILSVDDTQICIEAESSIKTCRETIANKAGYKNSFTLKLALQPHQFLNGSLSW